MLVRQLALGRELTGGATTTFSRRSAFFKADAQFLCRADDLRARLDQRVYGNSWHKAEVP